MNEEDIRSQLKEKNKEIYLNKLNLDLTNNLEVLVLTIDNILNNINNNTKDRVMGITESFQNETIIKEIINNFIEDYRKYLMELIDNKKKTVEKEFKEDKNDLKSRLNELNQDIEEKLNNYFLENIDKLIDKITNLYTDSFCNFRIKEYLKNIFKENLNNKIIDTLKNRDIILLNTFKETYLKYQDLNKNTIGVE